MAMKRTNAIPWWGWLTWVLMVVLGILVYTHLPPLVAGEHHRETPRFLMLYEPVVMLAIMLIWQGLWRIDPKRRNYEVFWPTYRYIGGMVVVGLGLVYSTIAGHLVFHLATIRFVPTGYGIIFILIANVLPRLRPNWWIGVRSPWTLSNEDSWNRSQRLAGQLGIPTGILIIILGWVLPPHRTIILAIMGPVILWVLILLVASYFFARTPQES